MIQAVAEHDTTRLTGLMRMPCPLCGCRDSRYERVIAGYSLEKCTGCSLVFMNPRCTDHHLAEIYTVRDEEELIELYARIATPTVLNEYHQKLGHFEKLVPEKGRLLDFACAAGYFFEQAGQRGWDAHGCDVGPWTARAAVSRNLKNMHVGEFNELGFPDNHFDVVYAAQVFEHLLNPLAELANLKRVLKPGGLLYIDVPNYHTLPVMFDRDDFMLNEPPQHINYFTPVTLRKLLKDGGLSSVRLSSSGGIKWENLLGRPITSDIAAAYGLVDDESSAAGQRASFASRCQETARRIAKATVVNPVLYEGMKVGMNLEAFCWKR